MSELTLLQLNDSHAYFELHPELLWSADGERYIEAGGYARIATLIGRARAAHPGAVLAFDCGDTFHGTYAAVQTEGAALLPVLNAIGFDAMTGHWEFAYGPQRLLELTGQLTYPFLAINCYRKGSDERVFPPYIVREAAGLRLGIIGIAATIVDKTMPARFHEGIYLTLGEAELPDAIEQLRAGEQVDLVIVISHLGFPQDYKLAASVAGVDVLLSAHTHNRLFQPVQVDETLIIQSGSHGAFLGRLDLTVENRRVVDYRHELTLVGADIEPDAEVNMLVDAALAPYRDALAQVVGATATPLHRYTALESTMDNFLLQATLEATGAEVAFSNGWRYGAPIPAGDITLNDLYNIVPMNPVISLAALTGDEIRAMLEENLEHTFARDPYHQMGGYAKRCLGLRAYVKIENPAGERIQELFIGNEPLRPGRVYQAATITAQGIPEKYGSGRRKTDITAIDAMRRTLNARSPISVGLRGTLTVI